MVHLVEAYEIELRAPQPQDHLFEEIRRYFEQPVGLKPVSAGRPDMVQGEDHAHAAYKWSQAVMGRAEIKCLETGADDGFLECGQLLLSLLGRPATIPTVY